jgi:protein-S-isoprenylcysteine O-methyltransferase Ste14
LGLTRAFRHRYSPPRVVAGGSVDEFLDEQPKRGSWLVRSRAWLTLLFLLPFFAAVLVSEPNIVEESPLDYLLDFGAWAVFLVGGVFRWWATLYIGGRKHRELVVSGPYSLCRNPLYFGTVLLAFSAALFLHSLVALAGLALATWMYLSLVVPYEEAQLQRLFGEEYDAYAARVPAFFPNPLLFAADERVEVRTEGLWAEGLRTLCWIWIPMLAEAVSHFRLAPAWPHWIALP